MIPLLRFWRSRSVAKPWWRELQQSLSDRHWSVADRETLRVMMTFSKHSPWIMSDPVDSDVRFVPCAHLRLIDQLWVYYSAGRFGFSVQREIFERNGRDWDAFGNAIGWRRQQSFGEGYDGPCHWVWDTPKTNDRLQSNSYDAWQRRLTFSLEAPAGHLPMLGTDTWVIYDYAGEQSIPWYFNSAFGHHLFAKLGLCGITTNKSMRRGVRKWRSANSATP